jgi:hypothetical protein
MKRVPSIFLLILFILPTFSSCELEDLELDPSSLVGLWDVNESSKHFKKSAGGFYVAEILRDASDSTMIIVKNFYELNDDLNAKLNGRDITIPRQNMDGYYVYGFGKVSITNNKIDWFL